MRLFRGLSTFHGDKLGPQWAAVGMPVRGCGLGPGLSVYCPPLARCCWQRNFCVCPQAVLSLIHISRGQHGVIPRRFGPFLTTPCRSLMRKGNMYLPSVCPHACPQNAGTNAQPQHEAARQRLTRPDSSRWRWISGPKISQMDDCAMFDRLSQVLGATRFFETAPHLSSSFSTVQGDKTRA